DNLQQADKVSNLAGCDIADYVDQAEFIARLDRYEGAVDAVVHHGACSDTMESDGRYMMENNYRYSKILLEWCQEEEVPLLYASSASVYGSGPEFREERRGERPLNVYGYSKFLFDQAVRERLAARTAQIAGLRYFNVYGPNEAHKGRIEYVPFPAGLADRYQSFTEADLSRLRAAGYSAQFMSVEQGVAAYVKALQRK